MQSLEDAFKYQYNGKQCGDRAFLLKHQNRVLEYHTTGGSSEGLACTLNIQNMHLVNQLDKLQIHNEAMDINQ